MKTIFALGLLTSALSAQPNKMINPPMIYETKSRGFSQGIETSSRNLIFLSGVVGWDKNRNLPEDYSFLNEARQALKNIQLLMKDEKLRKVEIVLLRFYVVDLSSERMRQISSLIDQMFEGSHHPATTVVGISKLARAELNIEIEAIFARQENHPKSE